MSPGITDVRVIGFSWPWPIHRSILPLPLTLRDIKKTRTYISGCSKFKEKVSISTVALTFYVLPAVLRCTIQYSYLSCPGSRGMADQTLSVPSLVFVSLLAVFAIRYFFFSSRTPAGPSRSRQIDPALIDQVAAMFPQADRRSIQWDLQRNGGSVAATTERILTRGSLSTVSFGQCA